MPLRQPLFILLSATVVSVSSIGCTLFADRPWNHLSGSDPASPRATSSVAPASYNEPVPDSDSLASSKVTPPSMSVKDFYPSNIRKTLNNLAGRGPSQKAAEQLYEKGEQAYRQAVELLPRDRGKAATEFLKASKQYTAAAERWPNSALEEDALFRAAEGQFFADRYVKANEFLEILLKKYPNTRYLDAVGARRFLIAKYWLELEQAHAQSTFAVNLTDPSRPKTDTFGHAVRIFDRMRIDDPTGKLADDATLAAANAYFKQGDFLKADQYYSDLRMTFPSSEHQFMAHFLGIKAKLESYKGPDYAGNALDQAEKLIKLVRRQFPNEARKYEQELSRAYHEVRYRKAERQWEMASYYAHRHEFGAARFYYQVLLKDYRDTPFADRAQEQVGRIATKPANPDQLAPWLVKLFPNSAPDDNALLMAKQPQQTKQR